MSNDDARQLTPDEEELIGRFISVLPEPERNVLRDQLEHASVVRGDSPIQVSLTVGSAARSADLSDGPLPVAAQAWDGGDYLGEVMLFVSDGRMSLLEFAWVTDERPSAFPPLDSIRFGAV
ncbi:hypothetical protein [Gordonia insulae]|uniref:Uncharacterized protein n=1 Tax=Gordonia insulae TaxID=2420509 RepID=A0A3G8JNT7_9ACTN|nr:hypothetical protein [Gordonia insulae]AZG45840.1 hypothetical protein D7316_02440 [Gordonia insulae]